MLQGANNIVQKLTALPFQKCQHHISSTDVQPSMSGGIMVFVTGQLMVQPSEIVNMPSVTEASLAVLMRCFQEKSWMPGLKSE